MKMSLQTFNVKIVLLRETGAPARPHCAPAAALFSRLIALAANFLPKIGSKNVFEKHSQIKSASERATLLRHRAAHFYLEPIFFWHWLSHSLSSIFPSDRPLFHFSIWCAGQKSMGRRAFAI
jgi:hypothetical protein